MAWKSSFRQNYRTTFSPTVPTSAAGISHVVADVEAPGGEKWEHLKSGGKQWQATPKNLTRMQRTRVIPVTWLNSALCPDRPKGWIPINKNISYYILSAQAGNVWQTEISEHVFHKSCAYLLYRLSWYIRTMCIACYFIDILWATLAHMEVCCSHARQEIAGRTPIVFALPTTLLGTLVTGKFTRIWEYPFSPFTSGH